MRIAHVQHASSWRSTAPCTEIHPRNTSVLRLAQQDTARLLPGLSSKMPDSDLYLPKLCTWCLHSHASSLKSIATGCSLSRADTSQLEGFYGFAKVCEPYKGSP